jgi:tRNA threonylcarbamoyladenosine biosynthesis protein TsaE
MIKLISNSDKETKEFGMTLAKKLKGGSVLALSGPLGAGKTALTQGLAKGFKIKQTITSPTFTLMNVYPVDDENTKNFVHVDCYRIKNADSLVQIGIMDFLYDKQTICVVEWADKIKPLLSLDYVAVEIKLISDTKREIVVEGLA